MNAPERIRNVLVSLSWERASNREFLKGMSRCVGLNANWKVAKAWSFTIFE